MTGSTADDTCTYELQLPQNLFYLCHKLPADSKQLLSATNNKDEEFCIAVRKDGDQWINLSIQDVHSNLFEVLPHCWRCSIKTVSVAQSGDPCETPLEVKPDVSEMEVECAGGNEDKVGRKLGRGCRRKRSTFKEMSCDYVMSKRHATRSQRQVDSGVTGEERLSHCKTTQRDDVAELATPSGNVSTPQDTKNSSSPNTSCVAESNSEAGYVNEPNHLVDDTVADDVKIEPFLQELNSGIPGQCVAEPDTAHAHRVRHRGTRNRKPYVAYEQVIIDNRAAIAALSKHEYHCILCPSYVCYTSKTLHNHIVFKHKMSSSAYQQLVATNAVDTNTNQYEMDVAASVSDPGCDTIGAATMQKLSAPTVGGQKKKQLRRTLNSVEKTIGCLMCSQQFVQRTSMIKHVKQMHMTLENTEEVLKLLEEDKIAHAKQLSPITVECPVCSMEQRGKRIITHMKKMHANEPEFEQLFELAKNKYYSIRSKLSLAREPSDRVSCPYCGRQFARVSMRGHIRYRCRSNSERTRLYNCNLCGYCTPYEDHLRTHKLQHPVGVKGFVCHVCGCTYRTRAGLMVHTRIKHNIIKEKPLLQFHCPVCQKVFHYSTQLTRHMSVHKVERDFECDLCSRTFKDEITLKRHRKTFHFNEYRYHCDKCGHGVEKRQYLERHRCGRIRHYKNRVVISRDNATDTVTQPVPPEQQTVSVFINENVVALTMDSSSTVGTTVNLGDISEWPGSSVEITPKGVTQEQLLFVTGDDSTVGPEMVYEEVVIPESAVITMMGDAANANTESANTLAIE